MIRLAAALRDEPNLDNHVAIYHHADAEGTRWCLEGRPGGVGWRDAAVYMHSRWTVSNASQPKTAEQRKTICDGALAMIGTPYDWQAIAADGLAALHLEDLWRPGWRGVPGHVVCSSLAAYLYTKAGLGCPSAGRGVTPADWLAFIISHGYT